MVLRLRLLTMIPRLLCMLIGMGVGVVSCVLLVLGVSGSRGSRWLGWSGRVVVLGWWSRLLLVSGDR